MRVSANRNRVAEKAVWGRTMFLTLVASLLLLPAAPTEANGQQPGKAKVAQSARQAERIARRHAKLDQQLNDAVEDAVNAESNVIIEFNDDSDAANVVKGYGGKAGRRLNLLKARVARI